MTREEAFEKLEMSIGLYLMSGNADDTYCGEWRKILEVLKTDACEDCISRTEAIYLADELKHDLPGNDKVADEVMIHNEAILEYQTKLSLLPSVTPQPKVGYWINGNPICPCCGEDKFRDLDADIWADWQPKYCPNCGCRMSEVSK